MKVPLAMSDTRAYFAMPGVSSHTLIELIRTPLHCWAKYVDPNRKPEEPTPTQRLGTLVHLLTLTPETFGDECVLVESVNRRTQAGKADYATLAATGKLVVSRKEYTAALQIVKAIHRHPIARGLLQHGEPEKVISVSRDTGLLPLKGRLDWWGQAGIVELKTAADPGKDAFLRDVYRYRYHLSAAYYRMLVSRHTGQSEASIPHTFVVVETKPPHAVAVYGTAERLLAEGQQLWETHLPRFDACWIADEWPGYPVETLEPGGGGRGRHDIEEGEVVL